MNHLFALYICYFCTSSCRPFYKFSLILMIGACFFSGIIGLFTSVSLFGCALFCSMIRAMSKEGKLILFSRSSRSCLNELVGNSLEITSQIK